jgi:hypothetical protein
VVYVPAYNPVVVYGPPIYPYPPIYYPPPGYWGGVAIGFGVGIAMGAFWGGGWGYGPRWGYGSVNININNRYVNHYNRYNNVNRYGGSWNHNPAHRGGAPYADRTTANRYGGTARGDTRGRSRPRQPAGTTGANRASPGSNSLGTSRAGAGTTGAGDRVGNRSVPSSSSTSRSGNAFGGASSSRPTSSAARTSSSRGSAVWADHAAAEVGGKGHDNNTPHSLNGGCSRIVRRDCGVLADGTHAETAGKARDDGCQTSSRACAARGRQSVPHTAGRRDRADSGGVHVRRTGAHRDDWPGRQGSREH